MTENATLPTRDEMERLLAEQKARQEALLATLTVPPCPSWCALPEGHAYDSFMDDETAVRSHDSSRSARAWVSALEHATRERVWTEEPSIELDYDTGRNGLGTVEQARTYLSDLVAATELLEALT